MKLLADANVAASTVRELRAQKEDVVSVAEIHEFALPDSAIVERARREGRMIVTFDQDFGRLLAMEGASTPSAIIIRLENQTPAYVTPRLLAARYVTWTRWAKERSWSSTTGTIVSVPFPSKDDRGPRGSASGGRITRGSTAVTTALDGA